MRQAFRSYREVKTRFEAGNINRQTLAQTRGQFELFYQPQVHLGDTRLIGAEALIRWRHPVRGLLTPDQRHALDEVLQALEHRRGPDAGGRLLLAGVTGSGKTEVYLRAVEAALVDLKLARHDLQRLHVRSPLDGLVHFTNLTEPVPGMALVAVGETYFGAAGAPPSISFICENLPAEP